MSTEVLPEKTTTAASYEVAIGENRYGPFTREAVVAQFAKRTGAQYWTEGMEEWAPVSELVMAAKKAALQAEHAERIGAVRAAVAGGEEARGQKPEANGFVMSKTGVPLVKVQRSFGTYVGLWLIFGGVGLHEFYIGRPARALLWMFWTAVGVALIMAGGMESTPGAVGCVALGLEFIVSLIVVMSTTEDGDGDLMIGGPSAGTVPLGRGRE